MNFAQILSETLANKGITAYKISKDTGISQTAISKWKKGEQYPTADKLKILTDYLGVTCDYLLKGENSSATPAVPAIQHTNAIEAEMLRLFRLLPEAEQLKLLGRTEVLVELAEQAKAEDNAV